MKDDYLIMSKTGNEGLIPGKVDNMQFLLLVEISSIHSEKVIKALGDYLVSGYSRKEACAQHNVSLGYFSDALKRLKAISKVVSWLVPFYTQDKAEFISIINPRQ